MNYRIVFNCPPDPFSICIDGLMEGTEEIHFVKKIFGLRGVGAQITPLHRLSSIPCLSL